MMKSENIWSHKNGYGQGLTSVLFYTPKGDFDDINYDTGVIADCIDYFPVAMTTHKRSGYPISLI